jgi:hypothetical protein
MSVLHQEEEGVQKQQERSNTVATASITSQQTAGKKGIQVRLRWAVLPKNISDCGAKLVIVNFLADSNEKDKVFARHQMTERPYCAEHGTIQKVWENYAMRVHEEVYVHNGANNVFGSDLSAKYCKAWFFQSMDFAKKYVDYVRLCSGDDSKPEPSELQNAIEGIYKDYKCQAHTKQTSKNDDLVGKGKIRLQRSLCVDLLLDLNYGGNRFAAQYNMSCGHFSTLKKCIMKQGCTESVITSLLHVP